MQKYANPFVHIGITLGYSTRCAQSFYIVISFGNIPPPNNVPKFFIATCYCLHDSDNLCNLSEVENDTTQN